MSKSKTPRERLSQLAHDVEIGNDDFGDIARAPRRKVADAIKVIAESVPEELITSTYLEEHCEVSGVASERVAWEAATAMIEEEASKKFLAGKDGEAGFLRDLAKQFRDKAEDASKRQKVLLKKQGIG